MKFNTKHSEYPDNKVYSCVLAELKPVQGIVMPIKVQGIRQSCRLKDSKFDPFIVYPNSMDIFDGHHRYHAFKEEYGLDFKVKYIEDLRKVCNKCNKVIRR